MAEIKPYGAGSWSLGGYSLPEFGLTEALGGEKQSLSDATLRSYGQPVNMSVDPQTYAPSPSYYADQVSTPEPTMTEAPGGYSLPDDPGARADYKSWQKEHSGSTYPDYVDMLKSKETEDYERRKKEASNISSSFRPIYTELDRQLASLPGQQGEYQQSLGELEGLQQQSIETERSKGLEHLEGSKEVQKTESKHALRNLAEDIRNSMQAAGQYIGTLGAGDSSATYMASEGLARVGQKARSGILETRQRAMQEIEMKMSDVNTLASQQLNSLKQYTTSKLFEVKQFFTEKMNQLSMQKANAKSSEQTAIQNLQRGLEQEFIARLRQLDDEVRRYQVGIEQWQMERQAQLEDYKAQVSAAGEFEGPQYDHMDSLDIYHDLQKGDNPLDPADARGVAYNITGFDPLEGYELKADQGLFETVGETVGDFFSGLTQGG